MQVVEDINNFKPFQAKDSSRDAAITAFSFLYDAAKLGRDYRRMLCIGQRLGNFFLRITPEERSGLEGSFQSTFEDEKHELLKLLERAMELKLD